MRKNEERAALSGVGSGIVPGGLNPETSSKHYLRDILNYFRGEIFTEFHEKSLKIAQKLIQSKDRTKPWTAITQVVRNRVMDGTRGYEQTPSKYRIRCENHGFDGKRGCAHLLGDTVFTISTCVGEW